MDLELKGKVAIIGGASKGLGRACAEVLAEEGARIAICSRTKEDLETAAAEIRDIYGAEVMVFAGDLDRNDVIQDLVASTVSQFGQLDIMINNSGGLPWRGPPMPQRNSGRSRCSVPSSSSPACPGRPSRTSRSREPAAS